MKLKLVRCPSNDLALTNCAIISDQSELGAYIKVSTNQKDFLLKTLKVPMDMKEMALGMHQRKWMQLILGLELEATSYTKPIPILQTITLDIITEGCYDETALKKLLYNNFTEHVFTTGQIIIVRLGTLTLSLQIHFNCNEPGLFSSTTDILFKSAAPLEWNFQAMKIGGLSKEFDVIFRRVFVSRVFPPDVISQIGCKHIRGLLLYGPPGCGKTLLARELSNLLTTRPPKLVNGPEILSKYVGESEANVRELFQEAENEQARFGNKSSLHVIILDEIDAICKKRGSGTVGVHDTVVNQLLTKLDGVNQLDNILVIGMTNRVELLDEALLRPGRFEVKLEIGLPDQKNRLEILNIHTSKMAVNNHLSPCVNLETIASLAKNYSGAELEGLVRAAQSLALSRCIEISTDGFVHHTTSPIVVTHNDFIKALTTDIKPFYASDNRTLKQKYIPNGILHWCPEVNEILTLGSQMAMRLRTSARINFSSLLIRGLYGSGKTALATQIALETQFTFVKICSPDQILCMTDQEICGVIKQCFDDASKTEFGCIILDDLESLLHYTPLSGSFSNIILQTLLTLLKNNHRSKTKLFVICTSSLTQNLLTVFDRTVTTPIISQEALPGVLSLLNNSHKTIKKYNIGIKTLLSELELN